MSRLMSKKFMVILILLSVVLMAMLTGCGGTNNDGKSDVKPDDSATEKVQISFPERQIKMIVWSPAGAPLNIAAQTYGQILQKYVDVPVVVEERPGGGGGVGMAALQAMPADGYTLLAGTRAGCALWAGDFEYGIDDFDMLVRTLLETSSIMVSADSPYDTVEDFMKYAKDNPSKLKIGGVGTATFHHSVLSEIEEKAGLKLTWVPFEGGNLAVAALLGGHIDAVQGTPSSAQGQIAAGEIKVLAVTTAERSQFYPEVPTLKEKGVDIDQGLWRGIFVKKGIPQETLDILSDLFAKMVEDPDWQAYLDKFDQEDGYMHMDEFHPLVEREVEEYKVFLKRIGMLK